MHPEFVRMDRNGSGQSDRTVLGLYQLLLRIDKRERVVGYLHDFPQLLSAVVGRLGGLDF